METCWKCPGCGRDHHLGHRGNPTDCSSCERIEEILYPGRMACRLTHHHILPRELLDSPALAAQLCPKAAQRALSALTTAAAAVAAHQPLDEPAEPTRMAVLDTTIPRPRARGFKAGQHPDREQTQGAKVLRLGEVLKRTGLSRTTIWRMERTGNFPERVHLGSRAVGWREAALETWLVSRTTERAG